MHELRRGPIVHDRLLAARQALLMAMESYAAELTARGLPLPRKLHGTCVCSETSASIRRLPGSCRGLVRRPGLRSAWCATV